MVLCWRGRPQSALGAETSDESPHLSVLAVFLGIFSCTLLRVTRKAWPMTKHHTQTVSPKRSCLGESSCQLPLAYWTLRASWLRNLPASPVVKKEPPACNWRGLLLDSQSDPGRANSRLGTQGPVQSPLGNIHSQKAYHLLLNVTYLLQVAPHYHKKPVEPWHQLCYHTEFLFYAIEKALSQQFRQECISYLFC